MNITDIRIRRTYQDTRLKALVSITVDHDLAVHDLKVIQRDERLFVAMPSEDRDKHPGSAHPVKPEAGGRKEYSRFRDIVHPITPEARAYLEKKVLTAYHAHLEQSERNADTSQDDAQQAAKE